MADDMRVTPRTAPNKTLLALGICAKAGKLVCGTPMICEALKGRHKPLLVLSASDSSGNTSKRLRDRCAFYGVELAELTATGDELAEAVGKSGKVTAVAVTDGQLCRLVRGTLEQDHNL